MPWPPGFIPVANVDQATGVWAGEVVATRASPPGETSFARFGSSPAASIASTMLGSSPSRPITITRFVIVPPPVQSTSAKEHTTMVRLESVN